MGNEQSLKNVKYLPVAPRCKKGELYELADTALEYRHEAQ